MVATRKNQRMVSFDGEDFEPTFDLKIDDFFGFTKRPNHF